MGFGYKKHKDFVPPESKMTKGKICFIGELTLTNEDLDDDIHKGFTIGKGKLMYWYMIFHENGYGVSCYRLDEEGNLRRRWIPADTEITVHFL